MSDSLRDQLLGLGFKPAPKPERQERKGEDRRGGKPGGGKPPVRGDHAARGDARPGGPKPGASGKPAGAPAKPGQGRPGGGKPGDQRGRGGRPGGPGGRPASREDIDLAKAYAIRAQREKDERIAAEQAKQEEARLRREARAKLAEMLKDRALNVADADIARHFPYGGKIKRIYVTAEQLKQLNAGELGVLQQEGRYLLVTAATLAEAEEIFAPAVALKVDPNVPAHEDPYADPMYQVPDDLVW
ncbi:DUF2058 family protein [Lysobacter sp. K5869]|uniref:DUF2058 domain-containing protein n=1 Tax=Lysobacter sp. K5869 TaxID=2820808 RepID=UPI001C0624DE|nr:DUF2058 family protein [Lysobacter sp. K5869]QWP75195.1 DUF2058 family protein [Lysobacter sp. K5869]